MKLSARFESEYDIIPLADPILIFSGSTNAPINIPYATGDGLYTINGVVVYFDQSVASTQGNRLIESVNLIVHFFEVNLDPINSQWVVTYRILGSCNNTVGYITEIQKIS